MAIRVEINNVQYPAIITGKLNDNDWNNRASKAITLEMLYEDAVNIFVDDVAWSIIYDVEERVEKLDDNGEVMVDENGNVIFTTIMKTESYDNSEYNIAGDIIDHRNGTVTVKMGKPTAEELLKDLDAALLDITYQNIMGGL